MTETVQKVQHLKKQFENISANPKFLIFDYDGTIATIPINWAAERANCRHFLQDIFPDIDFPEGVRVDEMEAIALHKYPEKAQVIFSFRDKLEKSVQKSHEPVAVVVEFLKQYILTDKKYEVFIVSNNLNATIQAGLANLGVLESFPHILGVDNVGLPKPHLKAVDLLKDNYNVVFDDAVMFGDSEPTDGTFSKGAGMPFVNINNFL